MAIEESVAALLDNVEDVVANDFTANKVILTNFLQHEDNAVIRIFVSDSNGYGHQATTVNIMRRLAALGFTQTFYVVYLPGLNENLTFPKLQRLLPGLTPQNQGNFDLDGPDGATCQFVSSVNFNAQVPISNIGFTGGYDDGAVNLGTTYRCNYFLKLQPYQWPQANTIARTGVPAQVDLATIASLGHLPDRGYYMPAPVAPVIGDFTGNNAAKWGPYNEVIAASANGTVNMMPIYGIGDLFGRVEANPNVRPETNLYNLISAVAIAQDNLQGSTAPYLQKGAIFSIIATVSQNPCWNNLNSLINGVFQGTPNLNNFSTNTLNLANRVRIIDFNDAELTAAIAYTVGHPNHILIVRFNGLPQPAFNYIYAQATLPSLFEGKGTANLALNSVPSFWWIRDTAEVNPLYPTLPLGAVANEPNARLMGYVAQKLNQTPQQTNVRLGDGGAAAYDSSPYLSARILSALYRTGGSDLQRYFTRNYDFFHDEEEDKLLKGTFYLLDYINQQNQ